MGGGWGWLAVLPPFSSRHVTPQVCTETAETADAGQATRFVADTWTLGSAEARVEPAGSRDPARPPCLAAPRPSPAAVRIGVVMLCPERSMWVRRCFRFCWTGWV